MITFTNSLVAPVEVEVNSKNPMNTITNKINYIFSYLIYSPYIHCLVSPIQALLHDRKIQEENRKCDRK